jgi:hypothetical protein
MRLINPVADTEHRFRVVSSAASDQLQVRDLLKQTFASCGAVASCLNISCSVGCRHQDRRQHIRRMRNMLQGMMPLRMCQLGSADAGGTGRRTVQVLVQAGQGSCSKSAASRCAQGMHFIMRAHAPLHACACPHARMHAPGSWAHVHMVIAGLHHRMAEHQADSQLDLPWLPIPAMPSLMQQLARGMGQHGSDTL